MYSTDRGLEELDARRGEEQVTLAWLADQLRTFVDLHPSTRSPSSASRPGWPASTTTNEDPMSAGDLSHSDSLGPAEAVICFVGASVLAGVGDPKALGWVGRVVARSIQPDLRLTAYNLGVRGQTSAGRAAALAGRDRAALAGRRGPQAGPPGRRGRPRRRDLAGPPGSTWPPSSTTRSPTASHPSLSA